MNIFFFFLAGEGGEWNTDLSWGFNFWIKILEQTVAKLFDDIQIKISGAGLYLI